MNSTVKISLLFVFSLLFGLLAPTLAQAASFYINVTKAGTGTGTVTSAPAGINCGGSCAAIFNQNVLVTLTAKPAAGSTFSGWTGACAGRAATCNIRMTSAKNVTATFTMPLLPLTVTKTGTGTGTVTSSPAGINCGSTCTTNFSQNSSVTLTAAPAAGSTFAGWSGACKGTAVTCTLTLNAAKTASASFAAIPVVALTVTKTGTGTGTVTSLPIGINCGSTCTANFNKGSSSILTAAPVAGSTFAGWSGACTGTAATCTLTLNAAKTATASFTAIPVVALTVTKTGTGTGTVTSSPVGINCGSSCTTNFNQNSGVTLTAAPAAGSTFTGWTGACTGTASTCTVTMATAQTVSASFTAASVALTVTTTGTGTGTIASSPGGINCGSSCIANFNQNSTVLLAATPSASSAFAGWTGACTGTATTCSVSMSQAQTVSASFSTVAIVQNVTTFQYDPNGNLTQVADPLGRIRQTQYDGLGQAVRELEPDPSTPGQTLGKIDTQYDSLGQVKRVTDPRNLSTDYEVDNLGNVLTQTSPDTGVSRNTYDDAGNLKTHTDNRGKKATYSYDSENRPTQVSYDDQVFTYTWDACTNGIGRLCGLANATINLAYNYDLQGHITNRSQKVDSVTLGGSHAYDSLTGQLTQTTTPGNQVIGYVWQNDRMSAVKVNGQALVAPIRYEADGQIGGWTWGNGVVSERHYDLDGRPTSITLGVDLLSQQPALRSYRYDAASRITGITDTLNAEANTTYNYDGLDRLIASQLGEFTFSNFNYAYDLSGNRTSKTLNSATETSSIDPGSNRLLQKAGSPTISYSYDSAGNLLTDGSLAYAYNSAGQRIGATGASLNATYAYNALGQRVRKTVNGVTTLFYYDGQGHLTGEYDTAGKMLQETVWLGDLPIAVLQPASPQSSVIDTFYIHTDHLGTPRKLTRADNNKVVWTWDAELFGNSPPNQNPSNLGNFVYNLRFPGQYYDQETGLHYNYFRDYDPANGRYIESDPIGLGGGINTYGYVGGNPLNFLDPEGLRAWRYAQPGGNSANRRQWKRNGPGKIEKPNGEGTESAWEAAIGMFTPDPDEGDYRFRCLRWECSENSCTPGMSPTDFIPPAYYQDDPPKGCKCTQTELGPVFNPPKVNIYKDVPDLILKLRRINGKPM